MSISIKPVMNKVSSKINNAAAKTSEKMIRAQYKFYDPSKEMPEYRKGAKMAFSAMQSVGKFLDKILEPIVNPIIKKFVK